MTQPDTNTSDIDLLLAACREQREKLPHGQRTVGEAIHGLVLEVLYQTILRAQIKKDETL